jgi:glucose-1-phosphate adenylyltransferase
LPGRERLHDGPRPHPRHRARRRRRRPPGAPRGHLSSGRPWDLDRTTGGLLLLHPRLGNDDRDGFHQGTADALWRNAPLIRDFAPEALVVVSADAV